jgi:hypothetical protein
MLLSTAAHLSRAHLSGFSDFVCLLDEIEKGKFLSSADLVGYYLKLKKDHPALISIEDGFDEKDYEGWTRMTEAFAKEHPGVMIVSSLQMELQSFASALSIITHALASFVLFCSRLVTIFTRPTRS